MTQQLETRPAIVTASDTMSYDEFLARTDEDAHREWVEGSSIAMPPVSDDHSELGGFLIAVVRHYAEARNLGVVRYEPFQMKLGAGLPGRAPDLMFIASDNLPRLQPTFLDGPADLVVEIVSPESRTRDRGDKFDEYEQGGVREYWLIDAPRERAEFYQRDHNGVFRPVPPNLDGVYHSAALPGLWLRVEWLWQRPLPPLLRVLREWGLI
jgi:Uma2 family endonuclease